MDWLEKGFMHGKSFEACICLWQSLIVLRWPCVVDRTWKPSYWLTPLAAKQWWGGAGQAGNGQAAACSSPQCVWQSGHPRWQAQRPHTQLCQRPRSEWVDLSSKVCVWQLSHPHGQFECAELQFTATQKLKIWASWFVRKKPVGGWERGTLKIQYKDLWDL